MNDEQGLALLLAGVYLVECTVRVPSGGLVVRRSGGSFRIARPAQWTDVLQGGLVLDDPLPPLDGNSVLQPWTVALSPEGVVAEIDRRGGAERRFVPWESVVAIDAEGLEVRFGGGPFARLALPEAAERLAATLAAIASAPHANREQTIAAAVDARLDADAVAARNAQWRAALRRIRISANVLFVAVMGLIFLLAGIPWLLGLWPWFLGATVLGLVWTVRDFASVHRRLHPGANVRRRRAILGMAISPLGAIRAPSVAGRDVYAAWDPLAVASVICDADAFRDFARTTLCALRHPIAPLETDASDPARRCEEWFRALLVERVERFLRRKGLDPASLLAAPPLTTATNRSWCPRCRAQYEIPSGTCADCPGVALVAFAPPLSVV